MSDASIWAGQTSGLISVINADGNFYEQWFTATASQTIFNLTAFQYTPGTNSIFVFKNGLVLRRNVDYTETSATRVTLTSGAALNDKLAFLAVALAAAEVPPFNNNPPAGGSTNQILAKASNTDYDYKWQNPPTTPASLLDGPRTNVASASTVDLTTVDETTRNILITGTTTIAGFVIPNGELFAVKFAAALQLTNSANLLTGTGANLLVQANDTCFIRAYADNQVEVLAYSGRLAAGGPAFSAYNGSNQSIPNTTATKLQFPTEEFDTAGCYDNATNYRFTPTIAGYYKVTAYAVFGVAISNAMYITIYKNGGELKRGVQASGGATGCLVDALIYLNGSTDYVEAYLYQDSGGSKSLAGGQANVYFQAYLARGAN